MYGFIDQEALEKVLDFARCQRPDGTYYGTAGKCRKGKLTGAKAVPKTSNKAVVSDLPSPKTPKAPKEPKAPKGTKASGGPKAPEAQKPKVAKAPKAPKEAKAPGAPKGVKTEKQLLENYQKLAKQYQKLGEEGKFQEAKKLQPLVKKAYDEWDKVSKSSAKTNAALKEKDQERQRYLETEKKINDRQRGAYHKLNQKDFAAIKDYTDDGGKRPYQTLNKCLRKPLCLDLKAKKHAKELDQALAKLPKNEDGDAFYRGIYVDTPAGRKLYDSLRNAQPGSKFKDPGFSSYSLDKAIAVDFKGGKTDDKNILIVSRNKELRPINLFSSIPDETEAILPRGQQSTIRKVSMDGNTLIVEVD